MPPPTGVVSGPLMATLYCLTASMVSFGSHSPYCALAFSPAGTSNQTIFFLPPYALATAASNTRTLAFQMSGPVPSPSMKGTMGASGTTSSPPRRVIAAPSVGGVRCTNCCMDVSRSDQPSLDLAGSHTRRRLVQGNLVL